MRADPLTIHLNEFIEWGDIPPDFGPILHSIIIAEWDRRETIELDFEGIVSPRVEELTSHLSQSIGRLNLERGKDNFDNKIKYININGIIQACIKAGLRMAIEDLIN